MKRYLGYLTFISIAAMLFLNAMGYSQEQPYTQNFDGMVVGVLEKQIDPAWSVRPPNSGDEANILYLISAEQFKSAPNSLKIVDNSSLSAAIVRKSFPSKAGGGHKVSVFLPDDGTGESVYLTLANGTNSTNRYIDILFTGKGELRYRTVSDFITVMNYERNKWYDVEVTWANNTFNLSIDGTPTVTNAAVINPANTPTLVEFKAGSNEKKSYYYIDDLKITHN